MNLPAVLGVGKPSIVQRVVAWSFEKAFGGVSAALAGASSRWTRIWDNWAGQWQQDVEIRTESVLTFAAVFRCIALLSFDIGKLRLVLKQQSASGVWRELPAFQVSPFLGVLSKPNPYQTRIKFLEQWVTSKLIRGNAYILKTRDGRGVVVELRVIDPNLVQVMISPTGEVFYQVQPGDQLALPGVSEVVLIPAREIIHDVYWAPEHPLIGVSPIGACGLAATQGLKIQQNSAKFFGNQSRAGFVLTAPGKISTETAARLKADWEKNFGGENFGRTAVLGDGLKPESFTVSAGDSQLVEQLGWTAEDVCRAFGVPGYKVGVGAIPTQTNMEQLDQAYYSQTLQEPIECIELLLTEGIEVEGQYAVKLDTNQLLRLDRTTRYKAHRESIAGGWKAPNEVRLEEDLESVEGGDSPYLQQQNYSLADLAKRSAKPDPFASAPVAGGRRANDPPPPADGAADPQQNALVALPSMLDDIIERTIAPAEAA